jgi:modification methylase
MLLENEILCGDSLDVLKDFSDGSVDLVVTSPPYNTGGKNLGYQPNSTVGQNFYGEYKDNMSPREYRDWIISVVEDCLRISRYVFWNMQFLVSTKEVILDLQAHFREHLKDIFIWQKQAVAQICVQHSPILANGYEFVFMLGQDNSKIFKYSNFPANGYVPNIQTWYKREFFPEHHATFPIELPEYFISNFTKEDDVVLDCFSGVGTTCVAAKKLGRRYIGIDISEEYCQIARERLRSVDTGVPVKESRIGQQALFI